MWNKLEVQGTRRGYAQALRNVEHEDDWVNVDGVLLLRGHLEEISRGLNIIPEIGKVREGESLGRPCTSQRGITYTLLIQHREGWLGPQLIPGYLPSSLQRAPETEFSQWSCMAFPAELSLVSSP